MANLNEYFKRCVQINGSPLHRCILLHAFHLHFAFEAQSWRARPPTVLKFDVGLGLNPGRKAENRRPSRTKFDAPVQRDSIVTARRASWCRARQKGGSYRCAHCCIAACIAVVLDAITGPLCTRMHPQLTHTSSCTFISATRYFCPRIKLVRRTYSIARRCSIWIQAGWTSHKYDQ